MKKRRQEELLLEEALLSNERTLLSYIRTAMATLIFGFGLIQFGNSVKLLISLGYSAIAIGIVFILIGLTRHHILRNKIMKDRIHLNQ